MQNILDTAPPKKNYDFIDAIRGISMMGIVAEHALFVQPIGFQPHDTLGTIVFSGAIQLAKFGTICFFLLAGFLIGENFTRTSALDYLKKRIKNTFIPWLFWSLVFLFTIILGNVVAAFKFNHGQMDTDYGSQLIDHIKMVYLYSSYWFIPNFLCCIALLLIFKRYLYSYYLGGIFLLLTLLYAANIYANWIEPRHTTAILGFVFFLWLGAQLNKNLDRVELWINKIPLYVWIISVTVFFVLGIKEEIMLTQMNSVDPYNSLRISNIIYSLLCFFLLLRIRKFNFINKIKPRETTFGIYLIHYIISFSILPEIFVSLKYNINSLPLYQVMGHMVLRFIIIYGLTLIIVKGINATRFKWSIGR